MLSAPRYLTGNFRKLGKHGHRALPVVILGSRAETGDRGEVMVGRGTRGESGPRYTRQYFTSVLLGYKFAAKNVSALCNYIQMGGFCL